MWPIIHKDRRRIIGLVSLFLTNYLILREPIKMHTSAFQNIHRFHRNRLGPFILVSTHALRTLTLCLFIINIQLACIRPVARIHSEPGSNSFSFRHISEYCFSKRYRLLFEKRTDVPIIATATRRILLKCFFRSEDSFMFLSNIRLKEKLTF